MEHTRDLSVIILSDLSSSVHITDIVVKAHKRPSIRLYTHELALWFMSVPSLSIIQSSGLHLLFMTLILWNQFSAFLLKRFSGLKNLCYYERFIHLNVPI